MLCQSCGALRYQNMMSALLPVTVQLAGIYIYSQTGGRCKSLTLYFDR